MIHSLLQLLEGLACHIFAPVGRMKFASLKANLDRALNSIPFLFSPLLEEF